MRCGYCGVEADKFCSRQCRSNYEIECGQNQEDFLRLCIPDEYYYSPKELRRF